MISIYSYSQKKKYLSASVFSKPKIDGIVNDTVWDAAQWEGDFVQTEPFDSVSPTFKTYFKIIYTETHLYVAIHALDNSPSDIYAPMGNRDEEKGDVVSFRLDSYYDSRTAFVFTVSASGILQDQKITNDMNWDINWNAIWSAQTSIDSTGWWVEMEIPFTQLRFNIEQSQVWGMQVKRAIYRIGEVSLWQYTPPGTGGIVYYFGDLNGIKEIGSKRQLSITPFLVGVFETYKRETDNIFKQDGRGTYSKIGFDSKIGLSNDFTLDVTVNPDFGQVDADPSEVNLTAFETYYAEKRPFFIEGKNMLEMDASPGDGGIGSDNLFYSRRLGRMPHYIPDVEDKEYLERPESTNILGALKLTGKTQKGLSVGVLESVTQKQTLGLDSKNSISKIVAEPTTNYFVGSVIKDFNKGETVLQTMFTATNRKIDEPYLQNLSRSAYTGGVDFMRTFNYKKYYFNAKFMMSHVLGDSLAMIDLQSSALRYFQRPDAEHIQFDSSRTSMTGTAGTLNFGKAGRENTQYSVYVSWRSPSLELNDIGYQREADHIQQVLWYNIRKLDPWLFFRSVQVHINEWYGCDFSGRMNYFGVNIHTTFILKKMWSIDIGHTIKPRGISNSNLRGGSGIKYEGGYEFYSKVSSKSIRKFILTPELFFVNGFNNSYKVANVKLLLKYQINDRLRLELTPIYNYYNTSDMYVDKKVFQDKDYYIVSSIKQQTLAAQLRINLNITPKISIQYYGQPFISTNDYFSFQTVGNPMADNLSERYINLDENQIKYVRSSNEYTLDLDKNGDEDFRISNPDFTSLEFISNLVVKYEFKPGSSFYFVWSQGRSEFPDTAINNTGSNLFHLFTIYPHDVFFVKFSYLIGR
ncbi:MAG: carbohydrate binding family 9 domain-containing protein [Bacteroidales bacterium]|nr:carbohydrate binding family 9 domain-containing protein [Bacteroidales bacterium]